MPSFALTSSQRRSASAPVPESWTLPCASFSVFAHELGDDRLALLVVDALGYGDDAPAVTLEDRLHIGEELVDDEGPLRQIDEMGAVVGIFARQRRSRGEEAGVPSHHHRDIDAFQRQIVEIGAGEGLGDEARRRRIAGRVIEADQIVVDGLRNMDGAKPMIGRSWPPRRRSARCRRNRCRRYRRTCRSRGLSGP